MSELDYDKLNDVQRYTQWAVFRAIPGSLDDDRTAVIEQAWPVVEPDLPGVEPAGHAVGPALETVRPTDAATPPLHPVATPA